MYYFAIIGITLSTFASVQAFYNVDNAYYADGSTLEEDVDWVGAFKDGLCVGSTKWAGAQTQIAVMGDDGYEFTQGYCEFGVCKKSER